MTETSKMQNAIGYTRSLSYIQGKKLLTEIHNTRPARADILDRLSRFGAENKSAAILGLIRAEPSDTWDRTFQKERGKS